MLTNPILLLTMSTAVRKTKSQMLSTVAASTATTPPRPKKRTKLSTEDTLVAEDVHVKAISKGVTDVALEESQTTVVAEESQPTKARRKSTKATEPTPADYPQRISRDWKVGAHISAAGGVEASILNAAKIGSVILKLLSFVFSDEYRAESFALFLKSQRKWTSKDLTPASIASFKARVKTFGYDMSQILPHGSYLVNLGNPDQSVEPVFL